MAGPTQLLFSDLSVEEKLCEAAQLQHTGTKAD